MAEYIEREAVLMALMNDGCTAKNLGTILELPAADVAEVKRGEWIFGYYGQLLGSDAPLDYKCSLCGEDHTDAWQFCPNCGAKMKG